jgi:hypothetical protein
MSRDDQRDSDLARLVTGEVPLDSPEGTAILARHRVDRSDIEGLIELSATLDESLGLSTPADERLEDQALALQALESARRGTAGRTEEPLASHDHEAGTASTPTVGEGPIDRPRSEPTFSTVSGPEHPARSVAPRRAPVLVRWLAAAAVLLACTWFAVRQIRPPGPDPLDRGAILGIESEIEILSARRDITGRLEVRFRAEPRVGYNFVVVLEVQREDGTWREVARSRARVVQVWNASFDVIPTERARVRVGVVPAEQGLDGELTSASAPFSLPSH